MKQAVLAILIFFLSSLAVHYYFGLGWLFFFFLAMKLITQELCNMAHKTEEKELILAIYTISHYGVIFSGLVWLIINHR